MLSLVLGASLISFAPILVKAIQADPTSIGVYRCFVASCAVLPFLAYRRGDTLVVFQRLTGDRRFQFLVLIAGFAFALDLLVWHKSIFYIGAGVATLLGNTQAFYLAAFGVILAHERVTPVFFAAVFLAFLGIYMAIGEPPHWVKPNQYVPGVLYGLLTGLAYASFLIPLQRLEKEYPDIPGLFRLCAVCFISGWFLVGFGAIEGDLEPLTGRNFVLVAVLGLLTQVIGWVLITRGLARVPLSLSGLVLLIQPALAILWGAMIYGETLDVVQGGGVILTLFAIYAGSNWGRKKDLR